MASIEYIASLISTEYRNQKIFAKEKKLGDVFTKICRNKYAIWGFLNYPDFSTFLSEVSKVFKAKKEVIPEIKLPVEKTKSYSPIKSPLNQLELFRT